MITFERVPVPSPEFEACYDHRGQEELLLRRASYDELVRTTSKLYQVYWDGEPLMLIGLLHYCLCAPEGCFVWLLPCERIYTLPLSAFKQMKQLFAQYCPRRATATCYNETNKRFARLFGFEDRGTTGGYDVMVRE